MTRLAPIVSPRHPIGSSIRRRRIASWAVSIGGLVATCLLAAVLVPEPRCYGMDTSKSDIARMAVKRYAYEAFGYWLADNPDQLCPDRLIDLDGRSWSDATDPWGRIYLMSCEWHPRGRTYIIVMSRGPDGEAGTADDIWSDR